MTIDRREFLYAGGIAAAATPLVTQVHAANPPAPNVAEFGVQPDPERNQTKALQEAIDRLTQARQPVILPPGEFVADRLAIPGKCAIIGFPGMTNFRVAQSVVNEGGEFPGTFCISGVVFEAARTSAAAPRLSINNADVRIVNCWFEGWSKSGVAIELVKCTGAIEGARIARYPGSGIVASQSRLSISACHFEECGSAIAAAAQNGTTIAQNRIEGCTLGVVMDGLGIVSGNVVSKAKSFGLKLGAARGDGNILAQSNLLRDCRIGIGVSSSGNDIMASLNMIAGAKDGAIRAFDGDKLVGPDLARQSAEAYLNLMVAGNVVR